MSGCLTFPIITASNTGNRGNSAGQVVRRVPGGTGGHLIVSHVGFYVVRSHSPIVLHVVLQRVLLDGGVNLPQVIDASVSLSGLSGLDEVGNGDRRQQPDDRHYDHDFHQGEATPTSLFYSHNGPFFLLCGVNPGGGQLL
jgi:hypothetical protein